MGCDLRHVGLYLEVDIKMMCIICFQAKRIAEGGESSVETVSLHIPLHRAFGAILQKLVLLPWDNEERGFLSGLQKEDDFKYSEDEVPHNAIFVSWFFECCLQSVQLHLDKDVCFCLSDRTCPVKTSGNDHLHCLYYRFCVSWIIRFAYLFGWHRFGGHILSFYSITAAIWNKLIGTTYYPVTLLKGYC